MIEGDTTERLYAWQHLSLAEMVDEDFSGAAGTPDQQIDANVPGSALSANLFMLGTNVSGDEIFDRTGTQLQYTTNASSSDPYGGALIAKDAIMIDLKLDDGVANTGDVYGVDGSASAANSCSDAYDSSGADYVKSETGKDCRLVIWID